MTRDSKTRFNSGAEVWANYNRQPLGRIRCGVTWHNLVRHLPEIADLQNPPRVLDAGGGSGELALRLAQRGYRVWLMDYAPAMLDQARRAAQCLPDASRAHLTFCLMSADEAADTFAPGFFDAITCHTLIEYLPNPQDTLRTLVGLLREGGLLSLSFVNRYAEVLRQVWSHADPAGALAKLEEGGSFCASLFDISGMAYTSGEVSLWLANLGLTVAAICGVRCFADYVPRERLDDPQFFDALVRLEKAAACRLPYMLQARYVHLLSHKNVELS
jgi:S-adenosylmethionine-dependent methyltransferase